MRTASKLRHWVTIQAPAHTADTNAGQISAWTDLITCPAEVIPTGGNKTLEGTIAIGTQGYRIRLRYRTGVDVTCRILWQGQPLAITSITDADGTERELVAICMGGVPT